MEKQPLRVAANISPSLMPSSPTKARNGVAVCSIWPPLLRSSVPSASPASRLLDFVVAEGRRHGYEWGGTIAGHLVGEFPHANAEGAADYSRVTSGNDRPMRGVDREGRVAHWILEVHLVDRAREIGGFYEELLDL